MTPATGGKSRKIPAVAIAVVVIGASLMVVLVYTTQGSPGGGTLRTTSSNSLSSSDTGSGGAILIQVVNESGMAPMAGVSVFAGPASSPNNMTFTPGGPTLSECVHVVPNGASVGSGIIVVNGTTTTTTFAACPMKEYTTDASGWISITDPSGAFYFIVAGNFTGWNYIMVGVEVKNVVNMTIPLPSGNVTVMWGSPGATQSRLPVLWPPTTAIWPCGEGVPSGSTVVPQGIYAGEYIAYSYVALANGTKAALNEDAVCSGNLLLQGQT